MKNKDLSWKLFMWILLLNMLMSMDVWFLWGVNRIIFSGLTIFYCMYFILRNQRYFSSYNNNLIISYILIFGAYLFTRPSMNMFGWIGAIMCIVPPFFVVLLKREYALAFFAFFKKNLGFLLFFSIVGWVLYLLHIPLPHSHVSFGEVDGFARYSYDNYYLFLYSNNNINIVLPRFSSIFTEPGFLGCIMGVLLFSEGFEIKKKPHNIIFLVALLFSFSLAGWVISLFGFLLVRLRLTLHSFFVIFLSVVVLFSLFSFSKAYNGGNNFLNNFIFSRIEYDDSSGIIQGYNRSSSATRDYFDFFIHSDNLMFGEGIDSLDNENVDWKSFMIRYGLVPTVLILFYYLWPALKTRKNRYYYGGVAIAFLLIAMQTTYGIFSCMYISLYALSIKNIENLRKILISNEE